MRISLKVLFGLLASFANGYHVRAMALTSDIILAASFRQHWVNTLCEVVPSVNYQFLIVTLSDSCII